MTAYKRYNIPATQHREHIPYGHELTRQEKEDLQELKIRKAKRQQVITLPIERITNNI